MPFERQAEQALFPEMLWSMPERRQQRPTVLIVGGHSQSLHDPLQAFAKLRGHELEIRILVPDSLRNSLGPAAGVNFAASTPAGSFALGGLAAALELAAGCQCLFVVGDLSNNQETRQFVDRLLRQHAGCKLAAGKIARQLPGGRAAGRSEFGLGAWPAAGSQPTDQEQRGLERRTLKRSLRRTGLRLAAGLQSQLLLGRPYLEQGRPASPAPPPSAPTNRRGCAWPPPAPTFSAWLRPNPGRRWPRPPGSLRVVQLDQQREMVRYLLFSQNLG